MKKATYINRATSYGRKNIDHLSSRGWDLAEIISHNWLNKCFNFVHKTRSNVAPCVGDVTCTNGCCRNNPCLNGGTCNEICEPTSVRYNCSCLTPFVGKHCEIQLRKSCLSQRAAGFNTSGLYTVIDDSNRTFQVFCDFNSEPGFAWNLIESFSLSNKNLFQVTVQRIK